MLGVSTKGGKVAYTRNGHLEVGADGVLQIAGMPVNALLPTDRLQEASATFGGLEAGHPARHGQSEVVRKDGIRMPVSATVSPITDPAGLTLNAPPLIPDSPATTTLPAAASSTIQQEKRAQRLCPAARRARYGAP